MFSAVVTKQSGAEERKEIRIVDVVPRPLLITCTIHNNMAFCLTDKGLERCSSSEQRKVDWIVEEINKLTGELHIVTGAVGGSIGVDGYL